MNFAAFIQKLKIQCEPSYLCSKKGKMTNFFKNIVYANVTKRVRIDSILELNFLRQREENVPKKLIQ